MKRWLKILVGLVVIGLIVAGVFWWIPYHELSKGQVAIIGDSRSGRGIYVLNPFLRIWHRLPTGNLFPWYMAWSPDGRKIAFTFSAVNDNNAHSVVGVAVLNLENMETEKVYVSPSSSVWLNVVTWTPDGQDLVFDVYEDTKTLLPTFHKLDLDTGVLERIPFPEDLKPQYFFIRHLEIAQNNDFVIYGDTGTYIASPNLKDIRQISQFESGFFLTPNRTEITIPCNQVPFCNYNINTNILTEAYTGNLRGCCVLRDGNWSYDEKDVVYLVTGGEGDPQYIVLLDLINKQNYMILKFPWYTLDISPSGWSLDQVTILQLTWHSVQ